ncbi:hypothetical protein HAX54_018785 [Datura stramonium]|uniref:Uncharacterized protein n=1 Tax=Datura stramonium TaxID=4076 RepID=A0ABS8UN37_DATST|nr:hypothetical protein [Datura stramonium]
MNPTTVDPTQPPPQPPQLTQPPRSSFSCDRHPDEQFTGFCPECLCERLTTLDNNNNNNPSSSSRRPSTSSSSAAAAAAIKSLFSKPSASSSVANLPPKPTKSTSFFPELRRTKSFSASKNEALGFNTAAFEPQRKSCDVRVRNTLWTLFSIDNETKTGKPTCSQNQNPNDIRDDFVGRPVKEEEEDEPENDGDSENVVDEITEEQLPVEPEIVVEEEVNGDILKPMKDHIDLDSQAKKASGGKDLKEIAGSFWSAASVFSKKWHNWRKKQKLKKRNNDEHSGALPIGKPISRRYRDTQSEIADYGFGRRSCDTDPRFSLDAGRISFDDPRYSFDEPRASWDGYLIGRSFPRMPPMVSVIEDAPVVHIPRSDNQIPVEEPRLSMTSINEDEGVPGGTVQTKEYYSDSSSRRRKSLDRSNSIRKTAAAVVAEMDEMKAVSNAKVLPAMGDQFLGAKVLVGERDSNSNSNSLRDDCSETFELTGFRDNGSVLGNGERKESKKSRRWAWNLWGFIHRRVSGNKDEEDDRYSRSNGVERSFSESWQDLRTNGDVRGGINRKVFRSNSSVSWRNSSGIGGSFGSARKSGVEMNGHVKKKRDDFVLERNRSARYSPNHLDNGLLRFYLTPMRGSRRGFSGKSRPNGSHSIARSLLRLY